MAEHSNSLLPVTVVAPVRGSANLLMDHLAGDMEREMLAAWRAGSAMSAEQWLDRHPDVKMKPEVAVLIIYEELCLREERGEKVNPAELYRRFPEYRDALSIVLSCHRLMHSDSAVFPSAGDEFGEFRLLRELGRGGAGRVFLATQPLLSDRALVVKLTPRTGDEHLSLARLQHTHIVPLFLVQDFPERNLRALCMPFLGGASWSWILQSLSTCPLSGRTGKGIVQALERAQQSLGLAANSQSPAVGFLERSSYEQAVCWIGSCLADALHHAHQRGLLHLDIKPSNVLLAGDGQPMLLDFHLAHEVDPARRGRLNRVGGTPGYMSPEQQRCVAAMRAGLPSPIALDSRSDIYSFGVLLYESLTGKSPPADEKTSRETLRTANPLIRRGMEDLLHKCLAPDRESRYADAGELSADLKRHIANLPFRGVANRSAQERWQKWRRRKPHSLNTWVISLTALAVIGGAGLFLYSDRLQAARSALRQGERDLADGDPASALDRLTAGAQAIRWLPGQQELRQDLQSDLVAARRARASGALHNLVEQLLFLDNVEHVPSAKLHELDAGCRAIWEARNQIAAHEPLRLQRTGDKEKNDLMDLALLWTRLVTRNAPEDASQQKMSKVLTIIDEAQELWGPSPALALAREQLSGHLKSAEKFASFLSMQTPRTAWEQDAVGRILLQAGKLEQARKLFEQATQFEPDAFWPQFHLALCAYRCQRFDEALRSASVCVALSPKRAECFYNRAICLQAVGQPEAALQDLDRALELDPGLGTAALQRGVVLAKLERPAEALDSLSRAVELGSEPARAYYQMALIHLGQHEWTAARKCVEQSLERDSTYGPARALQAEFNTQPAARSRQ